MKDDKVSPDNPYITFTDRVENGVNYSYRIRGIDRFGDISELSVVVSGVASDQQAPIIPDSISVTNNYDGSLNLNWLYILDLPSSDLRNTIIAYANTVDGQFEDIGSISKRQIKNTFTHVVDLSLPYHFFKIKLVDESGNESTSPTVLLTIEDVTPPAIPELISAEIDTLGQVVIKWKPNSEKDLLGYQLFYAHHPDAHFTNITSKPFKENSYTYQSNIDVLNEEIFFKIQSIDNFWNHSDLSDVITLRLPDKVPPAPAFFSDFYVDENGIQLEWQPSQSRDVVEQALYRRQEQGNWKLLKSFDRNQSSYIDTVLIESKIYEYNIVAIDDGGNKTDATDFIRLKAMGNRILDAVDDFAYKQGKNQNDVIFSWLAVDYPMRKYIIYRSKNDGPFRTFKTIDPNQNSVTVSAYRNTGDYKYYIIGIAQNGKKTRKSAIIEPII